MEFTFETQYDAKTLALMARALRKTIRKKHSRRSHIFGWMVTALAVLLLLSKDELVFDLRTIVTVLAALAIVTALLFEDRLNGYVAKKRMLPGTEKAVSVFSEGGFSTSTDIGKTEWNYDRITLIAESADFFVFIFTANHAQIYDKRTLTGGTADEFRSFLEAAAGKTVQPFT